MSQSNLSAFFVSLFLIALCLPGIAVAQSGEQKLITLGTPTFNPNGFIVFGKAPEDMGNRAGIIAGVTYKEIKRDLPDLTLFFRFGGTLELVTSTAGYKPYDIVISEIMWGIDEAYPFGGAANDTHSQWIELYNTDPDESITLPLSLLFTPFQSHPDRSH